jgi:hypothetical protein
MLRKSRETIGPNVDIRATTEFNACQDWHQITAQISSNFRGARNKASAVILEQSNLSKQSWLRCPGNGLNAWTRR